ncbi:MAG: ribulokinase [Actinomycetota bacterium]|nr:ribulokinase [Actinomycetota bacterium]
MAPLQREGSSAMEAANQVIIGVDYGTASVRAVVVDTGNGRELGEGEYTYPHGTDGVITVPGQAHLARQSAEDYVDGLSVSIQRALAAAEAKGFDRRQVVGIGVDTTGSSPIPVDSKGVPLALDERFAGEPDAMTWLWKDHTSYVETAEINQRVSTERLPYLGPCGDTYSSEWYWAKLAHFLRSADPAVREATGGWVELADFVPGYLAGRLDPATMARGICPAGHKAMYDTEWGGLPSTEFLDSIEPGMGDFRYSTVAQPAVAPVGGLTDELAEQLGLQPGIKFAAGAFDAHTGAVGAGVAEGTLVKIIGTSTCDTTVVRRERPLISGLCGSVPDSIIPGMAGLEAGQSAVGDIFNWFADTLSPGAKGTGARLDQLAHEAARIPPGATGLLGLDWHNGNRSVLVDPLLSGAMIGMTLSTTPAEFYRALIESTAFGAQRIIEQFEANGVPIDRIVLSGGIAKKSELLVQIYADVTGRSVELAGTSQTCAVGSAILASVAAGIYETTEEAQAAMVPKPEKVVDPNPRAVGVYAELYEMYRKLHDAFGQRGPSNLYDVMKDLHRIRSEVTS